MSSGLTVVNWCNWPIITQPIVFSEVYNILLTVCMFKQFIFAGDSHVQLYLENL